MSGQNVARNAFTVTFCSQKKFTFLQDVNCLILKFGPRRQNVTKARLTVVRVRSAGLPLIKVDVGVLIFIS